MKDQPTDSDDALAHEYDGIREYDNPLPGWWKNLFWASILFCVPYSFYYHGAEGRALSDDYDGEVAAFAESLLATYGQLEPDSATIARFMNDDVAMTGMNSLFKSKCSQCHRADGSGQVGPNLTDDYWLHVKNLPDVFDIISRGVPAKGMPAWRDQLTDTQRVLMASFVARLRRSPLDGKAKDGEQIPPFSVQEVVVEVVEEVDETP